MQYCGISDIGKKRKENQDKIYLPDASSEVKFFILADGMGGANAGEVASALAIETVSKRFKPESLAEVIKDDGAIQTFLIDTVKEADINIADEAKENHEHEGMGTTIVIAWIINDKVYVCWCGDSRAYVFNPVSGFTRLSKDHSFVQQLIDKGELDPANAHSHPYSNVITQCLGDASHRSEPEVRVCDLRHGDVILLCSDGLTSMCEDDVVTDVLAKYKNDDLNSCCEALVTAALEAGGHDNVTIALARMEVTDIDGETLQVEEINSTIRPKHSSHIEKCHSNARLIWVLVIILFIIGVIVWLGTKGFTVMPLSFTNFVNNLKTFLFVYK